jgi:hypothetical protein
MGKVKGIEIQGLEEVKRALSEVPGALNASATRNIVRKPANKIAAFARKLFTVKDTGKSKRSLKILKVRDKKQTFLEIGVSGRSLAWIFMLGAKDRQKTSGASTGDIQPIGNVIKEAGDKMRSETLEMIAKDCKAVIEKVLKKYLRGSK